MAEKDASAWSRYFTGSMRRIIRHAAYKTAKWRDRKGSSWVIALCTDLLSEFELLKGLGVKFSCAMVQNRDLSLPVSGEEVLPY